MRTPQGGGRSCSDSFESSLAAFGWSLWVVFAALLIGPTGASGADRHIIPGLGITAVKTLDQNWDEEAETFYNIPQGSFLVPYDWFLNLELAESAVLLRDKDNMHRLGYIPRTSAPGNKDGLPIGFVRDVKPDGADGEPFLGLTCAACHTGHVNFRGTTFVIDGAPTHGDFETLLRQLTSAMKATLETETKLVRFAGRVLGDAAADSEIDRLKDELGAALAERQAYNERNLPDSDAPPFGHGRVDAFGAILNEVAVRFAEVPNNHAPANAPVSYPVLWDAPQHDFVQWNGAAENKRSDLLKPLVGTKHIGALGRNTGEVLGVFGEIEAREEPSIKQLRHYPNSAKRDHLIAVEDSLQSLWSPRWPDDFPPIDEALKKEGEKLFVKHCAECHAAIDRTDPARTVIAIMSEEGTDRLMAQNFFTRRAKTGVLKGRRVEPLSKRNDLFKDEAPVAQMLKHLVQRSIIRSQEEIVNQGEEHVKKLLQRLKASFDLQIDGTLLDEAGKRVAGRFKFGSDGIDRRIRDIGGKVLRRAKAKLEAPVTEHEDLSFNYKARPLNGIWASAPYLHNGSIPNLDELLKRPADRSKEVFKIGSAEFDPVKVGFNIDEGDDFDPTLPGNLNIGHDYGNEDGLSFTDAERLQLIEYMKSL